MNILYLVIGKNPLHHAQTCFSIYSFLNQTDVTDRVYVITDAPEFYNRLSEKINIIPVNQAQLEDWQGEHKFFWRAKIMALEHICTLHPDESVLYLDTDTFLFGNLETLKSDLKNPMMHLNEGKLSERKSKTEKRMWQGVKNKIFGGITIEEKHCMWNAGVVGIPANKGLKICELALNICDEMLSEGVTPYFIEQFSSSVALSENGDMKAADKYIGHYWSNKDEWTDAIYQFLITSTLKNNSLEADIEAINQFDFSKNAVLKRVPNTQIRLKKLVEKWFPSEEKVFVSYDL
jgi:lipopolysaccharide biosynthesis glycosyltransferase